MQSDLNVLWRSTPPLLDLDVCGHLLPCLNGGTCENLGPDSYQCACLEGYSGTDCEFDDDVCGHTAPCQNGATCNNTGPNAYSCECTEDFTGVDCDIYYGKHSSWVVYEDDIVLHNVSIYSFVVTMNIFNVSLHSTIIDAVLSTKITLECKIWFLIYIKFILSPQWLCSDIWRARIICAVDRISL